MDFRKNFDDRNIVRDPPEWVKVDSLSYNGKDQEKLKDFPFYIYGVQVGCNSGIDFTFRWNNDDKKANELTRQGLDFKDIYNETAKLEC